MLMREKNVTPVRYNSSLYIFRPTSIVHATSTSKSNNLIQRNEKAKNISIMTCIFN